MAEAIALVGIAAAAAQFVEVGLNVVLHISTVVSKLRDRPRYLQKCLDQITILLSLADLASRSNTVSSTATLQLGLDASCYESLSDRQKALAAATSGRLSLLENAWNCCTTQAITLRKMLLSLSNEADKRKKLVLFKELVRPHTDAKFEQIFNEIEGYKSILSLCYGEECLAGIRQLQGDILSMHDNLHNFGQAINQIRDTLHTDNLPKSAAIRESQSSISKHCEKDLEGKALEGVAIALKHVDSNVFKTKQDVQDLVSRS